MHVNMGHDLGDPWDVRGQSFDGTRLPYCEGKDIHYAKSREDWAQA